MKCIERTKVITYSTLPNLGRFRRYTLFKDRKVDIDIRFGRLDGCEDV